MLMSRMSHGMVFFGGVATNKYDIVASSTTITPERQKQFDFSDPYYEVVQAVILPAGQNIKNLADLKGQRKLAARLALQVFL